jgi:sugar/nucleoside kinase (ribokinase family)
MTREHTFDILVAGEINPDLILSGDVIPAFGQVEQLVNSADLTVGSSSAIFSCGAARLGLKTAIVGVTGGDLFGHFMLDELIKAGVDVSGVIIDPRQPNGLSVILTRPGGDRAILTYMGTINQLRAEQVTHDLLRKARHLHVASYFLQTALQPGLLELFQRAHALGMTTSLDTNWDPSGQWSGFDRLLAQVDVFLPNQGEAQAISGTSTAEAALDILSHKCPTVAIKCGREGGLAKQGKEIARAGVLPVKVADTVGAGDSFNAGFLYGWLNGWSLEQTVKLAVACGSLSTRLAGGTHAQPTLDEAMKYV